MNTVWTISAVMLIAAIAITMFRLLAGPGTLDRLVALDTFVAVTMCSITDASRNSACTAIDSLPARFSSSANCFASSSDVLAWITRR